MSEKRMLPSRFLLFLISISVFLLIFSSVFLVRFSSSSFIPTSVFKLILVNNTSVYFNPGFTSQQFKFPFLRSGVSQFDSTKLVQNRGVHCQNSSSKKTGASKGRKECGPCEALLKVFMYDLPPEFHFGLLGWKGSENKIWPDVHDPSRVPPYPGGLNLQHSIEYYLTLDLLSSNNPSIIRPCSAIRVMNVSKADIIFVPFFASVSYNKYSKLQGKERVSVNRQLQDKLVQFLTSREEWKRLGGKDHMIVAHHPNSMLNARRELGSAMFVLADFGRYNAEIANLEKDIIAPYKHIVGSVPIGKSTSFRERPLLAYFQGAIYRKDGGSIRQELFYLLKDEKDVHFTFGSVRDNGIKKAGQGMASSKFCLHIAGDTPSSNRLFDAIVSHCVPVIISDKIELPFEDVLDYSEFCLFVPATDAVKKGYLLNLLRGTTMEKWTKMWGRLKEVVQHFQYQFPSQPGDAVDMIWEAISRKVSSVHNDQHRKNRYHGYLGN